MWFQNPADQSAQTSREAPAKLTKFSPQQTKDLALLRDYIEFPDPYTSGVFIEDKALALGNAAVGPLKIALHHENAESRAFSASVLGLMKRHDAVKDLLKLTADPDAGVQNAALRALGNIKDQSAIAVIGALLRSENDAIRDTAAGALGNIRGTQATNFLREEMLRDPENSTALAVHLGRAINGKEGIRDLAKLFEHEQPQVRKLAELAFSTIKGGAVTEYLRNLAAKGSLHTRGSAIRALGLRRELSLENEIINYAGEADVAIKRAALDTLGRIGTNRSVPALEKAISDPSLTTRISAYSALAKIRTENADKVLENVLSGPHPYNDQRAVVDSLVQNGRVDWIGRFETFLKSPNSDVSQLAGNALRQMNTEESASIRMKQLEGGSPASRHEAARIMLNSSGTEAEKNASTFLIDRDPQIRLLGAVYLLRQEKKEGLIEILKLASDSILTYEALEALANNWKTVEKFGSKEEGKQKIAAALVSENQVHRLSARYACAVIGDDCNELIINLWPKTLAHERQYILSALARANDSRSVEFIISKFQELPADQRSEVVEALRQNRTPQAKEFLSRDDIKQYIPADVSTRGRLAPEPSQRVLDVLSGIDRAEHVPEAAESLRHLFRADEAGTAAVVRTYLTDQNPHRRFTATLALANFAPSAAVEAAGALLSSAAPAARRTAMIVLSVLPGEQAKSLTSKLIVSDDPRIRCAAAASLLKLSRSPETETLVESAEEVLIQSLKSPDTLTRAIAASSLTAAKTRASGLALVSLLHQETEPYVRAHAERSLRSVSKNLGYEGTFAEQVVALLEGETNAKHIAMRELVSSAQAYGLSETMLRIPPRMLAEVIKPRSSTRPRVLVAVAPTDENGAETLAFHKLQRAVHAGVGTDIIEAPTDDALTEKALQIVSKAAPQIIWLGHSSPSRMALGARDPRFTGSELWSERKAIDVSDFEKLKRKDIARILESNGTITVVGCEAGAGFGEAENLSNMFWRLYPQARKLQSSVVPMNIRSAEASRNRREIEIQFTGGEDLDYTLERSRK